MYSRGCTYGRTSSILFWPTIPRHSINLRPPRPPDVQRGPSEQHHIAYRLSHATAAKDGEKDQHNAEADTVVYPNQSNGHFATRKVRFMTYDGRHDLGVEPGGTWTRGRYSDQIASFLPFNSALQPQRGAHKEDKLFINKLLKDKGTRSYDWRIALSDLFNYYSPEHVNTSKDTENFGLTPRSVQAAGSPIRYLRGGDGDQIPVRNVAPRSRNYRSFRLARDIPLPIVWSKANLAVYVEALAESQMTQHLVPIADKPQLHWWTNIGDIVAAFDTIFYSSASQKYLSVEACNTALLFFYKYGMINKARSLYIRMVELEMRISTDTFNLLLRGSAWQKDLHNFTYLLNNMTRRGFKPNEVTWTLFLQVNDSSKLRDIIVQNMFKMNMLDKIHIRRNVASHMIYYEIANHLGNGHDPKSFLDHMNNRYGNGWLSTISGNKLLDEVAKRKSTADSVDLLYAMKSAGFNPNDVSLNTLLRHCLPLRQHGNAFDILDIFKHFYRSNPGPQAYATLFLQAFRSRLPILCTVIWRSACIYGATSFIMRRLIFRSLLSYRSALDTRPHPYDSAKYGNSGKATRFEKFAKRFGVSLDVFEEDQIIDELELDPRRKRWKTYEWAHVLMERSLRLSRSCLLESDLPVLLHEALKMDRSWTANDLYRKDNWQEMFRCAIAVPVKPNPTFPRDSLPTPSSLTMRPKKYTSKPVRVTWILKPLRVRYVFLYYTTARSR